ncbi:MAG: hypothetical protein ACLGHG_06845 [Gammaproteobacteria bacterium]
MPGRLREDGLADGRFIGERVQARQVDLEGVDAVRHPAINAVARGGQEAKPKPSSACRFQCGVEGVRLIWVEANVTRCHLERQALLAGFVVGRRQQQGLHAGGCFAEDVAEHNAQCRFHSS